jgi:hypothetical protein
MYTCDCLVYPGCTEQTSRASSSNLWPSSSVKQSVTIGALGEWCFIFQKRTTAASAATTTIDTTTATAITPALVFFEEAVSFADSIVDDEEGIGDAEALVICGVYPGEASAPLDIAIEPDSADTLGDTDDDVDDARVDDARDER